MTVLCCVPQRESKLTTYSPPISDPVPLFQNLGSLHHPISTSSIQAQRYFNQGLTWLYGFNHGEAVRSFRMATQLDPNCAMCHWGIALALGPNINAPMTAAAVPIAWQETQIALRLADRPPTTPAERDYIRSLQVRYQAEAKEDRSDLDRAYASSMKDLARRYPQDPDAATLFAEAAMDTSPWDYWDNGQPRPAMQPAIAALATALKLDPKHPGAHHYYIHLMENAPDPRVALTSAEQLGQIAPGIAHLVHMPAHIFQAIGRYQDSVIANQEAIAADRTYLASSKPTAEYHHSYVSHNYHFLWSSAVLSGQRKLAIQTARDIAAQSERDPISAPGTRQNFAALPLYTLVQFGQWSAILQEPQPNSPYVAGVWHYARGMAFAQGKKFVAAQAELRSLTALIQDPSITTLQIWDQPATKFLEVARSSLAGTIAAQQGDLTAAITELNTAWKLANNLSYSEFGNWFSAIGYSLGQILLQADRPQEAEVIYRQELDRYPENGWSLSGLAASLQAQGQNEAAAAIKQRSIAAWKYSDFNINIDR
jgi:tetratricopeptide (TPR) repeat protein